MSETVTREERGWAGHYICADRCRFRRNTLLTCGERRVVVSTVGAQRDYRSADKFEEIGHKRYYETYAFEAAFEDGYWDADVSRQITGFAAPWCVDHIDLRADAEANANHEAVVAELTAKIAVGTLEVAHAD